MPARGNKRKLVRAASDSAGVTSIQTSILLAIDKVKAQLKETGKNFQEPPRAREQVHSFWGLGVKFGRKAAENRPIL